MFFFVFCRVSVVHNQNKIQKLSTEIKLNENEEKTSEGKTRKRREEKK